MKDLIKVLLYLLLVLLVIAISVMIYRRSKIDPASNEPTAEQLDEMFTDSSNVAANAQPMNGEDSMILDLTGQVASQVGMPDEHTVNPVEARSSGEIDYSKPINSAPATTTIKTPKAQTVSERSKNEDIVSLPKSNSKSNTVATKAAPAPVETKKAEVKKETKSAVAAVSAGNKGGYYVVAGSYIVPSGAERQVTKLKKSGYSHAMKKVFGSEEYYRAVAGRYESHDQATKAVKNLKSKGFDAFVKQ